MVSLHVHVLSFINSTSTCPPLTTFSSSLAVSLTCFLAFAFLYYPSLQPPLYSSLSLLSASVHIYSRAASLHHVQSYPFHCTVSGSIKATVLLLRQRKTGNTGWKQDDAYSVLSLHNAQSNLLLCFCLFVCFYFAFTLIPSFHPFFSFTCCSGTLHSIGQAEVSYLSKSLFYSCRCVVG